MANSTVYEQPNSSFPERLKEAMLMRSVNQKQLAEKIGVTPQSISYYYNGTRLPDVNVLRAIAQCLDVSADYLLGISSVTSSDIDIKAVNRMLGLSEKAINEMKVYLDGIRSQAPLLNINDVNDIEECLQKGDAPIGMSPASLINLLLDDTMHGYAIIEALGDIFTHKHDPDPDAVFVLSKSTLDGDKLQLEIANNSSLLTDADVLAVRLLKLQQAVAAYKKELDASKSTGDK